MFGSRRRWRTKRMFIFLFLAGLSFLLFVKVLHTSLNDSQRYGAAKDLDGVYKPRGQKFFADVQPRDHQVPPFNKASLQKTLGNYETVAEKPGRGPGEGGVGVKFTAEEKSQAQKSIKANGGINMYVSDKIALNRTIPDLRDAECKYWHYPDRLPSTSVIIVFANEGWSTLLRTVHSVLQRSPAHLLEEIILVDDCSDRDHLKKPLEEYIKGPQFAGKVRLVRNLQREGLIRSRVIGARSASQAPGQVLLWLDAHCEVGYNWLPPLLAPIAANHTTVVCPTIDVIDANDYTTRPQYGGYSRGGFDWNFDYKRFPLPERELKDRQYSTEPYRSPVMAGGLFAMDRAFFFELGGYDYDMYTWGGEQYEISFKIWMCGGSLLWVPCSRVGHIYRLLGNPSAYSHPGPPDGTPYIIWNYRRVAEIWMDDYKEYLYSLHPEYLKWGFGDISKVMQLRRTCKSFQWFMDEVAYDLIKWYPLPSKSILRGEIQWGLQRRQCLDCMECQVGSQPAVIGCHHMGGHQMFSLTDAEELRTSANNCLDLNAAGKLIIADCKKGKRQASWNYNQLTNQLRVGSSGCLDFSANTLSVKPCHINAESQVWFVDNAAVKR